MHRNKIIPYNPKLKQLARDLRKHSTLSEVLLWQKIKGKTLGYEFHRQVPIDQFIVDFFCHELMLAIEIDGISHNEKYDYDERRQSKLQELGVKFIRFSDLDVKGNLMGVVAALEGAISDIIRPPPLFSLDASKTYPLQRGIRLC